MIDLSLDNNLLTGRIPAELGQLTKLQVLRLAGNQLHGEIPSKLGELPDLTILTLAGGNQWTGCIPGRFRDVKHNDLAQLNLPFCATTGS